MITSQAVPNCTAMKAPDDRPEIELLVMTAFSAGSASRSALMAGVDDQCRSQNKVTQRSLKRRLHRLSARRAASYHRTTLVHLLTAMFSISRSILEVLVRAWQVLKHLWAFDCQNGTFMINVPQVAGWQPFASQLRCRLGILPIVQADDVAIPTKLD